MVNPQHAVNEVLCQALKATSRQQKLYPKLSDV